MPVVQAELPSQLAKAPKTRLHAQRPAARLRLASPLLCSVGPAGCDATC
jgi:hypothetical protein